MSDFVGDWHALLVLVIAGFLPNEVWRMIGLWLGGGVDEGSELLVWVRAVATAILAGERTGLAALLRGGGRICDLCGDTTLDFCRRGLRRNGHAGRQRLARLRRDRARDLLRLLGQVSSWVR